MYILIILTELKHPDPKKIGYHLFARNPGWFQVQSFNGKIISPKVSLVLCLERGLWWVNIDDISILQYIARPFQFKNDPEVQTEV